MHAVIPTVGEVKRKATVSGGFATFGKLTPQQETLPKPYPAHPFFILGVISLCQLFHAYSLLLGELSQYALFGRSPSQSLFTTIWPPNR